MAKAITQSELARRWGYTQAHISKLCARGMPLTSDKDAAEWLFTNARRRDSRAKAEDIANAANALPRPFTLKEIADSATGEMGGAGLRFYHFLQINKKEKEHAESLKLLIKIGRLVARLEKLHGIE
jgi:hypothetical protein